MPIILLCAMTIGQCHGGSCRTQAATAVQPPPQVSAFNTLTELRTELADARREVNQADADDKSDALAKCREIQGKIDATQDRLVLLNRANWQARRYPYQRPRYDLIQFAQQAAIRNAYRQWR